MTRTQRVEISNKPQATHGSDAKGVKRSSNQLTKEERAEQREEHRINKANALQAARAQQSAKRFADKHIKPVTTSIYNLSSAAQTLKKMKAPKPIQVEVQTLLKDMKQASTSLTAATFGILRMPHWVHTCQ